MSVCVEFCSAVSEHLLDRLNSKKILRAAKAGRQRDTHQTQKHQTHMKIIGILRDRSDEERLALITESPVTNEVLDALPEVSGAQLDRFQLSLDGELLMANPPLIKENVELINGFLGQAKDRLAFQKQESERRRREFLEAAAKRAGLPLQ
jgi:hypothetical protein